MYVYAHCHDCQVYYNKIDYWYAMKHDIICEECGKNMQIAPENPRP